MDQKTVICACAGCREDLFKGDDLVQNPVYKMGELDYIELAHRACIPEWAQHDNWEPSEADIDEDFCTPADWERFMQEQERLTIEALEEAEAARTDADEEFRLGAPIKARGLRSKIDSRYEVERDHNTALKNGFYRRRVRRAGRHAGKAQARELLSVYG